MNHNSQDFDMLDRRQRQAFDYFLHETNPANGLVIDTTAPDWPPSIAATGMGLACYPVAVERGFMSRMAAVERTLATLLFLRKSPQGTEPDATGYKGFYYHFLDMQTAVVPGDANCPQWIEVFTGWYINCRNLFRSKMTLFNSYGFKASYNPTHPGKSGNPYGWRVSP